MYTRLSKKKNPTHWEKSDLFNARDVEAANDFITDDARTAVSQGAIYVNSGKTIHDIPDDLVDETMRRKWENGEVMDDARFNELFELWDRAQTAKYAYLSNGEYDRIQRGRGGPNFDESAADAQEDEMEKRKLEPIVPALKFLIDQQAQYRDYFAEHPYQTDEERAERVRKFKAKQEWEAMREAIRNEPDDAKRRSLIAENMDIM